MAVTITQEITLDVVKYNTYTTLYAKQYDISSRFLKVTVQQNGVTLDVSDATSATINIRRPDDTTIICLGTVNSDGTVTVPLPNFALQLDGKVKCSVGILTDDTELKTLNFTVEVQQAETDGDSEITEDENYGVLLELISTVQAAVTAEEARVSAENARVTEYNSLINNLNTKLSEVETELADIKEAIEALNSNDGIAIYYDDDDRLSYDYTE